MRIAFLVHHPNQYLGPMFRYFASEGKIEPVVYFISDMGVSQKPDPETGIDASWDIPVLEGYGSRFLNGLRPVVEYLNAIHKEDLDAIVVGGYVHVLCWLTFARAKLSGVPVLLIGDTTLLYQKRMSMLKRILKRAVAGLLFPAIDAFLPTGTLSAECFEAYGAPRERVFIVPYAVDNEYCFATSSAYRLRRNDVRSELGIDQDRVAILMVTKLIKRESPRDVIQAFERLKNRKKASLLVVGDGGQRKAIETYVSERGLDNVHLFGHRRYSELFKFYAVSDVFVHPAHKESWGLSVNEAMACGLPVVAASSVGSSYDLVRHNWNGFVYPTGNIDALSSTLELLIDDAPMRRQMGQNSLEMISSWNYASCVRGILDAMESFAHPQTRTP